MRLFLGIIIFIVWASLCRYGYVCKIKGHCDPEPLRVQTLDLILDDSITYLKDYDQFLFKVDSIQPSLNENNNAYLDSLASVMKSDSAIFLTITGFYRPSEQDKAYNIYEDYGVARAAEIRALLAARGVPENQIASLDSDVGPGEELIQPVAFLLFSDRDATPDEYSKVQYRFKYMTYSGDSNFEKDSPIFQPKEAFRFYADSVKTYFELNPSDTLRIVGHCDIDGTDQYNLELGKQRAENAKQYLTDSVGVVAIIITESKGESAPAFKPANIEANMRKNRRVDFIIE